MTNSAIYKGFCDIKGIVVEVEEEAELTLYELQKIVMELSRKVAKLERLHAKF